MFLYNKYNIVTFSLMKYNYSMLIIVLKFMYMFR